jgi:hypothetical protein
MGLGQDLLQHERVHGRSSGPYLRFPDRDGRSCHIATSEVMDATAGLHRGARRGGLDGHGADTAAVRLRRVGPLMLIDYGAVVADLLRAGPDCVNRIMRGAERTNCRLISA